MGLGRKTFRQYLWQRRNEFCLAEPLQNRKDTPLVKKLPEFYEPPLFLMLKTERLWSHIWTIELYKFVLAVFTSAECFVPD
jgi:hypothetical protein